MKLSANGEPQISENVGSVRRPRMVSSGAAAAEAVRRATAETMSETNMILDSFGWGVFRSRQIQLSKLRGVVQILFVKRYRRINSRASRLFQAVSFSNHLARFCAFHGL